MPSCSNELFGCQVVSDGARRGAAARTRRRTEAPKREELWNCFGARSSRERSTTRARSSRKGRRRSTCRDTKVGPGPHPTESPRRPDSLKKLRPTLDSDARSLLVGGRAAAPDAGPGDVDEQVAPASGPAAPCARRRGELSLGGAVRRRCGRFTIRRCSRPSSAPTRARARPSRPRDAAKGARSGRRTTSARSRPRCDSASHASSSVGDSPTSSRHPCCCHHRCHRLRRRRRHSP